MMMKGDTLGSLGSSLAGLFFIWATIQRVLPDHLKIATKEFFLSAIQQFSFFQRLSDHFTSFFSPYVEINFPELQGLQFNQAYSAINAYLVSKGIDKANRLRASQVRDTKGLVLKREDTTKNDEYKGFKVWWKNVTSPDGDKSYQLTFHSRARSVITTSYIQYVVEEGTLLHTKNKKMKLFSNEQSIWRINDFEHPASFQTFAMDPEKKQEIIDDLLAFINGKEYYKKIGKAWKRGYLLYGPPGSGKSTMIAAMANLLNYCIYDLDLTSVHNNLDLKKLLTTTFSRSIIVIEDIDCSVNLTGNRIQKDNLRMNEEQSKEVNSVTLSGLLNFIDGIWSACGQERIIVFTTNHLQKLDPALIRRGRMDMRIELSYCTYEAFKVLAKNYLDLCDDHHPLFEKIKTLLEGTMITPADLAETLMARNQIIDVDGSLNRLIQTLERMNNYQRRQHYEHKEKQDRKKHKKYNIFGSLCSKS
ncbi:AAA-ATPase At5g40000-like [Brassica rapa]|uniref:AAA+ ATPase domain-containing protein n=1 Tax=Brassica campestris TaxID=3711 RepID=M4D7M5_BRACM|nr:AAA-ATPase At5g40000-like [Brassica rapa]